MIISFALLLFSGLVPLSTEAESGDIVVTPQIIDEKAMAGDILEYEVKIKNNGSAKADIYAMVNDISEKDGEIDYGDPGELDRDKSITTWLEFKRGVIELLPGTEMTLPLKIDVGSSAKPGQRYARIAFPVGSNKPLAEAGMAEKTYSQLQINIEVVENIIEKSQISGFSVTKKVFLFSPISFLVRLDNNGNRPIVPEGYLYLYNRRGEEVAKIDANPDKASIEPEKSWEQAIDWQEVSGLGKFKAKLEIEYGEKDKRDLQDTLFFWYFPWKFLALVFVATFFFLVGMIVLIFRRTYIRHQPESQVPIPVKKTAHRAGEIIDLKK